MKDKKSTLNKKVKIEETQSESIIRLFGLFFIVYAILCFTNSDMGLILSTPFTFLVGSFAPIALLALIVIGCFMLLFKKKMFNFSAIQYAMLALIVVFILTLATATDPNQNMSLSDCFSRYVGKDGIYKYNYRFIMSNETESVSQLGGGMLGYMFFGIVNSITGKNFTLTIVLSTIILCGVIFIFAIPLVSKFIKWCKKVHIKNKEKKEIKKQKQLVEKEKNERLKEDRIKNSSPLVFNSNITNDNQTKNVDDLLETTEINISGDDYSYNKTSEAKVTKLSAILNTFDEEIYPESMKGNKPKSTYSPFNDVFSSDFNNQSTNEVVNEDLTRVVEINDITQSNENKKANLGFDGVAFNEVNISTQDEVKPVVQEEIKPIIHEEIQPVAQKQEFKVEQTVEQIKPEETITPIKSNEFVFAPFPKEEKKVVTSEPVTTQEGSKEFVDLNTIDYELPPLYLLKDSNDDLANSQNEEVAREKAEILLEKMKELNVNATINAYVVGPSVTRFEIALAPGVRVNAITNLQEDFKLALGVNSIRIESPIPGKSAIGIEVPNKHRAMVTMKEIITKMPTNKRHKLYVPVGKDISGTPLSFPICDMPHCLISGATNSGKSVCANTIILSLLMNYKPSEIRLIMVDPKRVEMLFYKDIPHLLCPIITEAEKARVALDKLCIEMDKRFTTFSNNGVKNIASYNEKMVETGKNKMPFILLVVDEFAELMLSKNHAIVEEKIQKLAQLGRAAGIHLLLATQRPDVNVIPGTIKTNLPCRMTFRLSSLADSRTVIDLGGAEKLLNNGDMLLLTPDFTGLRRVQGVYVSDKEIADVVEFCKKQVGPQYDPNFLDLRTDEEKQKDEQLKFALEGNNKDEGNDSAVDSMYEEVKSFVIKEQKASSSFLQRKFGIGYSKAARFIDMLEEEGIVGPENGSKPREVLVSSEDESI